jgi:hypothetical protein
VSRPLSDIFVFVSLILIKSRFGLYIFIIILFKRSVIDELHFLLRVLDVWGAISDNGSLSCKYVSEVLFLTVT